MARYTIDSPPRSLALGDTVVFDTPNGPLEADVEQTYLVFGNWSEHNECVGVVREACGLAERGALKMLAEASYGYPTHPHDTWPAYQRGDFQAATRLVWVLYGRLATATKPAEEPKPTVPRFRVETTDPNDACVFLQQDGEDVNIRLGWRGVAWHLAFLAPSDDGKMHLTLSRHFPDGMGLDLEADGMIKVVR